MRVDYPTGHSDTGSFTSSTPAWLRCNSVVIERVTLVVEDRVQRLNIQQALAPFIDELSAVDQQSLQTLLRRMLEARKN